jgi:type IV pilus assembly protein PilN
MRLNINLASQPYEAAREFGRRMTMLIAGLGIVAVLLVGYIVYQRAHTRSINRQLAEVQQQIDALSHEEAQARVILNKPANRVIADQADFLNQLFARKALSWTHIFTEMEKIVPPNLHVVSMKPDYSKTNDLVVHMVVATDSRDRAVELVRHMENSSHFRNSQVVAEAVVTNTSDQSAGGGNIQFDIAAIYVPNAQDNDQAPEAGVKANSGTKARSEEKDNPAPAAAPVKKAAAAPVNVAPPGPHQVMTPNSNPVSNANAAQNRPMPPGRSREH